MKNTLALINLHDSPELGILTEKRPLASTTFLGRYTFVDFALSNLTNSGVDDIGILIKDHFRSVVKHIRNNTTYLKNTKTGYINLMINEEGLKNPFFNTDINNIEANDYWLYDEESKYVIIVPIGIITKIDYQKVIDEHIQSGKKCSLVYSDVEDAYNSFYGLNKITINALGNVQKIEKIGEKDNEVHLGIRTIIFNKEYLKEILKITKDKSRAYTIGDLLIHIQKFNDEGIHAIKNNEKVKYVDSLKKYYEISIELKNYFLRGEPFFDPLWKIFTVTHSTRPVLYGLKCEVKDSLIANGCSVYGKVKNSILARNVVIEEGASVEDSIIFTDCIIKKGVHLKRVVADKLCVFENKDVIGKKDELIYIPQGDKI